MDCCTWKLKSKPSKHSHSASSGLDRISHDPSPRPLAWRPRIHFSIERRRKSFQKIGVRAWTPAGPTNGPTAIAPTSHSLYWSLAFASAYAFALAFSTALSLALRSPTIASLGSSLFLSLYWSFALALAMALRLTSSLLLPLPVLSFRSCHGSQAPGLPRPSLYRSFPSASATAFPLPLPLSFLCRCLSFALAFASAFGPRWISAVTESLDRSRWSSHNHLR